MPSTKYPSTKRYGARYGRSIKEKLGKAEQQHKTKQSCPFCTHTSVVRKSYGLWHCRHCMADFTGLAYTVERKAAAEEKDIAVLEVTKLRVKEEPLADEE